MVLSIKKRSRLLKLLKTVVKSLILTRAQKFISFLKSLLIAAIEGEMIVRAPVPCMSEHATVFPEHPEQLVADRVAHYPSILHVSLL